MKNLKFFSLCSDEYVNKTTLFFQKEIVLQNDEIKLSPLKESSIPLMTQPLFDKSLWAYNPFYKGESIEEIENFLKGSIEARKNQKKYPFIIKTKKENRVVGTTSFYNIFFEHECISIGWTMISKRFQKTGANLHNKLLLLQYCFEELEMKRVEFHLDLLNQNSFVSLLKLGAKFETVFRSNINMISGRRRDTVTMAILAEEWPHVKSNLIRRLNKKNISDSDIKLP